MQRIAIAWQVGSGFGWGEHGYQIARRLLARGKAMPMLLEPTGVLEIDALEKAQIDPILGEQLGMAAKLRRSSERPRLRVPVLHALGNEAAPVFCDFGANVQGNPDHALLFLESSRIDLDAIESSSPAPPGTATCWSVPVLATSWCLCKASIPRSFTLDRAAAVSATAS
ncbi:MAG: hypothetical protein EXQ92_08155 [Alphaproteobacteria bacterium]|nr:hypothetical protein [Alphaproteobacteria bacterium]